jgi:hypothetical protein
MDKLPIPEFFDADKVGAVWRIPYEERAKQARDWALQHGLQLVDAQNTFCIPGFELFVGGRSGNGAVEDNVRLCEFIYRNIGNSPTSPPRWTRTPHSRYFIPSSLWTDGNHPAPYTDIHVDELQNKWTFNPEPSLRISALPQNMVSR